jgi:hypothetical protein
MKVVTLKDVPNAPMEGAERIEGYTGPVSRSRQTIIQPGDSANYNFNVGDVVHIKAGERHWHGAKADTTMGHITITAVGSQATHG